MIEGRIRKWGNSYGILLSKEALERHNLNENEEIVMEIKKKNNLEELYGLVKFKQPIAKLMKEIKAGYDD